MRHIEAIMCTTTIIILTGCAAAPVATTTGTADDIRIDDLRCEYRLNPAGIDMPRPRLSWVLTSDTRGQRQTAYQIVVGTSPELLSDRPDVWDSGRVDCSATNQVEYDGKKLKSNTRYFWKVRVWDKDGKLSAWSNPRAWVTGLMSENEWRAEWIGYDEPLKTPAVTKVGYLKPAEIKLPKPRYLRKAFNVQKEVRFAVVHSSALGLYEMTINGHKVGSDWFTPGWTDYSKRVYYNTYDVTVFLKQGGNAIGAVLADGWYAGYLGFDGGKRGLYGEKTRFAAQLHIEYKDGSSEVIVTDGTWKANTGPLFEADLYMGEGYDARAEVPGWDTASFNDAAWAAVNVTDKTGAKIEAYPGVNVRQLSVIRPVTVNSPEEGAYVFDMGQYFAGVVQLKVSGNAGDKITLHFAERLNPDGTVYLTNLRFARAMDTYICKGGDAETWQPKFTFHGFQYVEVRGLKAKPTLEAVTGIPLTSETPAAGSFESSDEVANKLYSNIVWTQRANFIDIPTDCPQRDERLGWTGDAQVFVRTATYNSDVSAFFTKWLVDLEDAQGSDGAFPDVAPRKGAMGGGTAAWGDAGAICPWTIYEVYGDKKVLEEHYDAMVRWVDYCTKHSRNLIRPRQGYGDWLSIKAQTAKDVLATAYFAYSTKLTAKAAEALGNTKDAEKYDRLFDQIKEQFNREFVTEEGKIRSDTQTVYVLALAFDLLPKDRQAIAERRLIGKIEERDWHLSTGFVGTKDLMGTLTKIGRTDAAYTLFHNDTFPSWGFSIKHGATSIWERWDGWTPDQGFQDPNMNSFAHYSYGAVAEWMFRTIAGIDTDGPGYRRIIIKPQPGGKLAWAKTSYRAITGPIESSWRIDGGKLTLDVVIPANTSATIYVPTSDILSVTEGGKQAAFDQVDGVDFVKAKDGYAIFEVASGKYQFESKTGEQE